ncbi:DUF6378 domain-containing protein [Mailhella sp.]
MNDSNTREDMQRNSGFPARPMTIEALEQVRAKNSQRGRAICEDALSTINGLRQDQYGNPEDTFKQIAALWEAYLGAKVTPPMVADMMCLLKIAREQGGQGKKDNMVDLIGYAALGASMRGYDA